MLAVRVLGCQTSVNEMGKHYKNLFHLKQFKLQSY